MVIKNLNIIISYKQVLFKVTEVIEKNGIFLIYKKEPILKNPERYNCRNNRAISLKKQGAIKSGLLRGRH